MSSIEIGKDRKRIKELVIKYNQQGSLSTAEHQEMSIKFIKEVVKVLKSIDAIYSRYDRCGGFGW